MTPPPTRPGSTSRLVDEAMRDLLRIYESAIDRGIESVRGDHFASAWERAGAFRDASIVTLATLVMSRLDDAVIAERTSSKSLEQSYEAVLKALCDFAFRYLPFRSIAMAFDLIAQQCAGELSGNVFLAVCRRAAVSSVHADDRRCAAVELGVTAMYRSRPSLLMSLNDLPRHTIFDGMQRLADGEQA